METVKEWSTEFDILYNNIASNKAPGLTEYEKSVFLTRAQEEVVRSHFSPKSNQMQEGIDDSIERQSDFSSLVISSNLTSSTSGVVDPRAVQYDFPSNVMFMLNEQIFCHSTNTSGPVVASFSVAPLSYSEYTRVMAKPYKYPPKSIAWRLLRNATTTDADPSIKAEIIARVPANTFPVYSLRYVMKPFPIILENLNSDYGTIDGMNTASSCKLPAHLHNEILVKAVELAKAVWENPIK